MATLRSSFGRSKPVFLTLATFLFAFISYSQADLEVPQPWKLVKKALPQQSVSFTLALRQRNVDQLEALFHDVSNPESSRYGQYLSVSEITDIVAPSKEEHASVVDWLIAGGVPSHNIRSFGDVIKVSASVETVEGLFPSSKLQEFEHDPSGFRVVRHVGSVRPPAHVASLIVFAEGLDSLSFPTIKKRAQQDLKLGSSDVAVTPAVLRQLYSIRDTDLATHPNSSQSVGAFGGAWSCNLANLRAFEAMYGLSPTHFANIPDSSPTCLYDQGLSCGTLWKKIAAASSAQGESCLDIQYVAAVGVGAATTWWGSEGWMYDHAVEIFNAPNPGWVHSFSYGYTSSMQCRIVTQNCTDFHTYLERTNVEFMKLGLRGVTLLVASGDEGAPGEPSVNFRCDGNLVPEYPASSPYVLSVGATMFGPDGKEVACQAPQSLITTGGGFSEYFSMPQYQVKHVQGYLNSGVVLPTASKFNTSTRAYPDISALGHNYVVCDSSPCVLTSNDQHCNSVSGRLPCYTQNWFQCVPASSGTGSCNGCTEPECRAGTDGTSASAPVMAGIITLLNDWRFRHSLPPLGFINPWFYALQQSYPAAFQDITKGDNKCTKWGSYTKQREDIICCEGFYASPGWDPVTGLGTPNYQGLLQALCARDIFGAVDPKDVVNRFEVTPAAFDFTQRDGPAANAFTLSGANLTSDASDFGITFAVVDEAKGTVSWANTVLSVTSQANDEGDGSATQILGAADVYPAYGPSSKAWRVKEEDRARLNAIELDFGTTAIISRVNIYETYLPGAVVGIYSTSSYAKDNTLWVPLWTGKAVPAGQNASRIFSPPLALLAGGSSALRVVVDPSLAPEFQIDAISVLFATPKVLGNGKVTAVTPSSLSFEYTVPKTAECHSQLFARISACGVESSEARWRAVGHLNTDCAPKSGGGSSGGMWVGIGVGVAAAVIAVGLGVFCYRRRRASRPYGLDQEGSEGPYSRLGATGAQ